MDVCIMMPQEWSLPSRERGLKCRDLRNEKIVLLVAPLAGAWIEIFYYQYWREVLFVAPLAGAWIEIGLVGIFLTVKSVAPLAGAWIEITP